MKTTKPKYVLLDANIVIEAYELGIWQMLTGKTDVYVPSIVVNDEAILFKKEGSYIPEEINLRKQIDDGNIFELTADAADVAKLYNIFDTLFLENIHSGEREAFALLYAEKIEEMEFCTADAAPIKAIAMLQLSEKGVSFEALLKSIGIKKKLRKHFTKKWFKEKLKEGKENLITGEGLKEKYRGKIL